MKMIPLTKGQVALVDDEDFARFGHLKWCAQFNKKTGKFYARRAGPRPQRKKIYLHREIVGALPGQEVDHKNHDTLDCRRRRNLRVCTKSQNMMNRRGAMCASKSGTRGVHWAQNRWIASIQMDGKSIHIGRFLTMESAAIAYAAANRKHFGAFSGKI